MSLDEDWGIDAYLDAALKDISRDNAKAYLGVYGDSIDKRVHECLNQAADLFAAGYNGPALCLAVTSIEVMVRFMLLRPLVQSAFLSDEWAEILADRVATGRTAEDRELLPAVLKMCKVDIGAIKTPSGGELWESVLKDLWPRRNKFVHEGECPPKEVAGAAIECARCFRETVIEAVASMLGFTLATTGKWCEIEGKEGTRSWGQRFTPQKLF